MTPVADVALRVGARIRELRLDAELTQRQLAKRIDTHRPIMSRIERGLHQTDLRTIALIADVLELDVATVLVCLDDPWIEAGCEAGRFLETQPNRPAM
jgi:transcriptional regulator with XRE-family HTH domain